jgi:hypothetical protein
VAELTLGSFNLHMGRGSGGHDAPFYDVVTACKEVDTDVRVVQEAWVPDGEEGDVPAVATALGYRVAATFAVARASATTRCGWSPGRASPATATGRSRFRARLRF